MNKIVSILIPAYNVGAYIRQCLDSIVAQSYRNLQVVVVNDGSTDDTLSICNEYAEKYPYIEVYFQANAGVTTARNTLLSYVKGDYVLFVDADDWIESDMVEYLLNIAMSTDADIVTCGRVVNDTKLSTNIPKIEEWNQDKVIYEFLRHVIFNGSLWNKLIKTSLLHNIRFHCGISYGEDALFLWQVLQGVEKVIVSDKQLYHYRMNESSLSHQSFGHKKMTGYKVWTKICEETEELYPQFLNVAQARFCIETTLLLRDASHCGYREVDNVRMLQQTIRKYRYCLNHVNITSIKMKIYVFLACRSYWLAGKI